ncbi:inositol 2-dehydrogenase [Arthrobacter sp. VKM Ac-2550]|uniref:inositol 2-dehydrogenase n=1 Tax=Crystallibacter permensis TaxID=1938888 RepID=UPI002226CA45|nr:inositol 2-dehydrogenase [Arthrobacter sp. VKM Ac-2550]MCW2131557.1 myo-inositol 2-dehydrogenase / D-chiro-inositol 1-dehydrogenase [Arthrobacter sp. VKM Ac-2550]
MSSSRPLRLALFGSGRIGQVHARNLAADPDIELVLIADPFIDAARALASQTGARAVQDPEEVFAAQDLDGVIIGSPTNTHVDLMTRAAERGLAVLCEKPIDLDLDTVLACRDRVKNATAPIMLGFNRRFDPGFAAVNARVAAGEIGPLEQLTIISRDPAPAPRGYLETSGGIFRDMTIHDLDMARFFVPDIVEVTAVGANQFSDEIRELGDYDSVVVTLRGRGGELISITNSRHCSYGYDQRLEAFGPEGMLEARNLTPTAVRKHDASGTELQDPIMNFFLERYAEAYRLELQAFARAIRSGTAPSPGFADGLAALVLADAAVESAQIGKTVKVEQIW